MVAITMDLVLNILEEVVVCVVGVWKAVGGKKDLSSGCWKISDG